eukprot:TRINITY_DN8878_c0_g1_i12.p1 TRINITY_DN8878_c0_g1~~TRINITY_DN8878_c0_g1_i12.p1  ORF type:complete len:229 (+),score=31.27 TRINITY_DN8878_c0_g1_i12:289-975(+)
MQPPLKCLAKKPASNKPVLSLPSRIRLGYCRFYMPYFDVSTKEVLSKIGSALIPYNGSFHEKIKAKADLYVPFWTYITISMLITVVSNTMRYLNDREHYGRFDFSILIASFTFISVIQLLLPGLLWLLMKYLSVPMSLLEIVSIYGYSFVAFIPAFMLCIIPNSKIQWLLLLYAAISSMALLIMTYKTEFGGLPPSQKYFALGLIVMYQIALIVAFKVYFFSKLMSAV